MVHRSVHHDPFSAEEERMASTVLYMSISLDGFIAGPNERWDDNPLGDELERVWVLEGEHGVTHLRHRVRRPRGA